MMQEIVDKNAFEIMAMPNNLVLIAGSKIVILCSFHSTSFVKYVFFAKI